MVRKIINEKAFMEMARIGFIPIGTTNTVEVYVHTNDAGKIPHFHIRKYGSNNQFEWETCVKYDSANYFVHGHYDDKIPDRKIIKELDKMLRTIDKKDRNNRTYWQKAIDAWNDNNSDVELDLNLEQPDYTKL